MGRYERSGKIEIAELSNGCAGAFWMSLESRVAHEVCCTASDDLVASVQDLVNRAYNKPFHHMVIELSGVGECLAKLRCYSFECREARSH